MSSPGTRARTRGTPRPPFDANALLGRWRHLPTLDAERFRRDVGAVLDGVHERARLPRGRCEFGGLVRRTNTLGKLVFCC